MGRYLILDDENANKLKAKLLLGFDEVFLATGEDYPCDEIIDCDKLNITIQWDKERRGYIARRK